jgi:glycosyltransferase involved in cell wall biosynthesis
MSEKVSDKNKNIKLSIAIPTYNGAKYIREALDSIIAQLDDIDEEPEIVISDNASTDETLEVIREYQKKYPSLWLIDLPVLFAPNIFPKMVHKIYRSKLRKYLWNRDKDE